MFGGFFPDVTYPGQLRNVIVRAAPDFGTGLD